MVFKFLENVFGVGPFAIILQDLPGVKLQGQAGHIDRELVFCFYPKARRFFPTAPGLVTGGKTPPGVPVSSRARPGGLRPLARHRLLWAPARPRRAPGVGRRELGGEL